MNARSWLSLSLPRRLAFVLLAVSLAWFLGHFLESASLALNNHLLANGQGWPGRGPLLEATAAVYTVTLTGTALFLLALWPGAGGVRWLVFGLVGFALSWLLAQAWLVHLGSTHAFSYSAGLERLREHHYALSSILGDSRWALLQIALAASGVALLPWAWALSKGWQAWSAFVAFFNLLALDAIPKFVYLSKFGETPELLPLLLKPLGATLGLVLATRVLRSSVEEGQEPEPLAKQPASRIDALVAGR